MVEKPPPTGSSPPTLGSAWRISNLFFTIYLPYTRHGIATCSAPVLNPATALGFPRGRVPERRTSVIQ